MKMLTGRATEALLYLELSNAFTVNPAKMKSLSHLILVLTTTVAHAQTSQKVFFNREGKKCDQQGAYVYQITQNPEALKTPGFPTNDRDTLVTVYFAGSNKVCKVSACVDGYHHGPYTQYYENGKLKEAGFSEKSFFKGKVMRYYPNGSLQEMVEYPADEVSRYTINSFLILDYRDSLGVQMVKNGNGICHRYFFTNGDSSHVEREDGLLKDGLREQEWKGYEDDSLYYKDKFSHGKFMEGVRYDKGKEIRYDEIEHQPEYHGGLEALSRFISKTLRYPKEARLYGVDGKVFVQFVVLKNGTVTNVEVIKGVSPSLNDEAVRVVNLMPNWEPGMQRGKPVKARFVLPIRFKLDVGRQR